MICNSSKTVCMVVNPKRHCSMVAYQFPNFMVNNVILKYVNEFKYLGHVVSNSQLDDAILIVNTRIYSVVVIC